MDIIERNFFRLLRSGALNEYEALEPMTAFKWDKLYQLLKEQQVVSIGQKGLKNHQFDPDASFPQKLFQQLQAAVPDAGKGQESPRMYNRLLHKRFQKIHEVERHAIDTSTETLQLLDLIVRNANIMLDKGISFRALLSLGSYLRTKGDKVDFVKLETWLRQLRLQRMAQLEGSILICGFNFVPEELPFVYRVEPKAYAETLRALGSQAGTNNEEWHFKQSRTGFVHNNVTALRHRVGHTLHYLGYAPVEAVSSFFGNFAKSLSEIEE